MVETTAVLGSAEQVDRRKRYLAFALLLLALNTISSLLFMAKITRPVFDDQYNIVDVKRYAAEGLKLDAVKTHVNPPGPTSFVWMAEAVRALGGDALRDARLGALASWLVLALCIVVAGYKLRLHSTELWYAALLVTMTFPHAPMAMATVLTEGPAAMFAVLGAIAWAEFMAAERVTGKAVAAVIVGGLCVGLAVTSRQYYLALLACWPILLLYRWRSKLTGSAVTAAFLSLAAAVVPILCLVLVWHGLSSPNIVAGVSYTKWSSKVGINVIRPLIAAFYVGLYFLPLTISEAVRDRLAMRKQVWALAVVGGIAMAIIGAGFVQPGPLRTLLRFGDRLPHGANILLAVVAAITIYNFTLFADSAWERRGELIRNPAVVLSILVIVFFILEQVGVGGNIPFYDLYVLQIAPFLGVVAFAVYPRLKTARMIPLALLWVVGQVTLWRYLFRT
ncbi:MAG: hypothetical protein ABSC71_18570 [Candidatus Acidiferrales bacterium]|jgi:hypothetical protein